VLHLSCNPAIVLATAVIASSSAKQCSFTPTGLLMPKSCLPRFWIVDTLNHTSDLYLMDGSTWFSVDCVLNAVTVKDSYKESATS